MNNPNRPTTYAKHAGRAGTPNETQLDIFSTAAPAHQRRRVHRVKPKGHEAGNEGLRRAIEATERRVPGWTELAVAAVKLYVATTKAGEKFTMEALRQKVEAGLPPPHDLRSWGNVPRMCCKLGILTRKKGEYAPAESSNGSPKPVYRRGADA